MTKKKPWKLANGMKQIRISFSRLYFLLFPHSVSVCAYVCVCVNTFHCILCETKAPEPEIVFFFDALALGHKETKIKYFRLLHIEAVAEQIVCAVVLVAIVVLLLLLLLLYCCCSLLKCIHV